MLVESRRASCCSSNGSCADLIWRRVEKAYSNTVKRSKLVRAMQQVRKDTATRRVEPTAIFHEFANQNHLRYRAATLHEHNKPNHYHNHTNKSRTIMHKEQKQQKDSPLVRARKLSFIDNKAALSEDFTEYLK